VYHSVRQSGVRSTRTAQQQQVRSESGHLEHVSINLVPSWCDRLVMSHQNISHRPILELDVDEQGKTLSFNAHIFPVFVETVLECVIRWPTIGVFYCRPIVWVPRQLVAYMAIFGTQFFSLKICHRIYVVCYAENKGMY